MNWKDIKITVMGLGLNQGGVGVVRYLLSRGARVHITDLKSEQDLQASIQEVINLEGSERVSWRLGEHQEQDFLDTEIVIKNPAVPDTNPLIKCAKHHGVMILTEGEIFSQELRESQTSITCIGVTGTRGKTTTTVLIYHLLTSVYGVNRVALGGNVGLSLLDIVDRFSELDWIVLELSSFQLTSLTWSPDIAVFTNLFSDHLNWHGGIEEYFQAKANIFRYQTPDQRLIINGDQDIATRIREIASSQVWEVSQLKETDAYLYDPNTAQIGEEHIPLCTPLRGEHNYTNILLAISAARCAGVSREDIIESLPLFSGAPGRQELVTVIDQVEYINDTTSTMPEALVTAIKTFQDKPFILIAGGENKGLSYQNLASWLPIAKDIIFLPGQASKCMQEICQEQGQTYYEVSDVCSAVQLSHQLANSQERVVFSPGATSFGLFHNEFHRGEVFNQCLEDLHLKT